uniref:Polyprotein n=1 Tax=Echinostoma caproni TaxID=27848 RepID=A0A183A4S2_9TREM
LDLELTTMRISSGSNVASREVPFVHQADEGYVMPSPSRLKFAPDITLKPDSMKPLCEAAVQSEMEYQKGSAALQMPEFQILDGSVTTSRSPITFRETDNFGNTLINLPKRDLVTFEGILPATGCSCAVSRQTS